MGDFEELYRRHVNAVFGYAVRCVGRREIAEEITSEAFLTLYQNLDRVDKTQLPAWLMTVAKNRAVDFWRRQAVEQRYAVVPADTTAAPSLPFEAWLRDMKVLKPVHRVCLILRYAHGMDRAEISQRTGLTSDQVKSCLQYARRLIRSRLLDRSHRGAR